MPTLSRELRKTLEKVCTRARTVAEDAAAKAMHALAVGEREPHRSMTDEQKSLRNRLRAHGRQLGDRRNVEKGTQELQRLITECAYEQWHRMLFARFLSETQLLIEPASGEAISLSEVKELASERKQDWVTLAGEFAVMMLPQVFRQDDPVLDVQFTPEDRKKLDDLLQSLSAEIFLASDSLGWCYQFWQAERKDEVNASGNKIGAEELPAVTQLFTEDYMVDFLLDNTLGAWHAGKMISANPKLSETATSEDKIRQAVSLPDCPWKYLRFIKGHDDKWTPAAGTFDSWPKTAKELKCLDPCMGSGHFVVAMFERLVALRMAEEKLDEKAAVLAGIRDNLFGLELDPRCTQIGAFNLALAGWRRVGHCALPAMNLACSGLAPNMREADWLAIAGDNENLQRGMERLYRLFQKAAALGSLINPRADEGDLLVAAFHELQAPLEKALAQEVYDETAHETAVAAHGLNKAAEILARQFTLVATNVPYLGRGKQDEVLMNYCERVHPEAKADLAACFLERCLEFGAGGGSIAVVTPQNWLFQSGFQRLRVRLLHECQWSGVAKLGTRAFQGIGGEVVTVALTVLCKSQPPADHALFGLDVGSYPAPESKAEALATVLPLIVGQTTQHDNPEARIGFDVREAGTALLGDYCECYQGVVTGDIARWVIKYWEVSRLDRNLWSTCRSPSEGSSPFDGQHDILRWEQGEGQLHEYAAQTRDQLHDMHESGNRAWTHRGVVINRVKTLRAGLYYGEIYHNSVAAIVPKNPALIGKVWSFCNSPSFEEEVRRLSPALGVTNRVLIQIPFDPDDWNDDLPEAFSSDPTQWLFNGHPAGADQPLHVAVARLLGYEWPRQTGSSFPDCPALGPDGLEKLADDDGIVALSPAKGEGSAAQRLRELLTHAYGTDWSAAKQAELLAQVNYTGATLEDWLRNGFFEQHCALFHNRPFIWSIWDGLPDGFHALVNYHNLAGARGKGRQTLEKLTFSYLGDWITRQKAEQKAGKEGADGKLAAALHLQDQLKAILDGEAPYDLFVRWKPLHEQAVGWEPDINDGVRMNIRPFMMAKTLSGKSIFRKAPKIKWDKDRGKEPERPKKNFPWFWGWDEETDDFEGGRVFDGNRWNDLHYSNAVKHDARADNKEKRR